VRSASIASHSLVCCSFTSPSSSSLSLQHPLVHLPLPPPLLTELQRRVCLRVPPLAANADQRPAPPFRTRTTADSRPLPCPLPACPGRERESSDGEGNRGPSRRPPLPPQQGFAVAALFFPSVLPSAAFPPPASARQTQRSTRPHSTQRAPRGAAVDTGQQQRSRGGSRRRAASPRSTGCFLTLLHQAACCTASSLQQPAPVAPVLPPEHRRRAAETERCPDLQAAEQRPQRSRALA